MDITDFQCLKCGWTGRIHPTTICPKCKHNNLDDMHDKRGGQRKSPPSCPYCHEKLDKLLGWARAWVGFDVTPKEVIYPALARINYNEDASDEYECPVCGEKIPGLTTLKAAQEFLKGKR